MGYQKYDSFIETGYEWLGEIPESWKLVKAKWLFKEKSIKGYPDERLLSVSKGRGLIPRDELEFKTVMAFKDLENFKLVKQNDFVIHLRSFQSGFEMSDITGIVSPAYTVFEGKEDVCPYYYKYLFYMKHFIDAIASTTQSLRDGKPIAYGEFGKMELPLPSKEVQSKISDFLDEKLQSIDKLIVDKTNLIKLLEEKRQAIITEAVTKGLNPNVKMKDTGVEWIGEIPEHWGITKIKYTTYVKGRIGWQGLKSDEFIDEGPYLVTGTDFNNGVVDWRSCYHISDERYNEAPPIQLKENDLLITKDGTIGKVAVVRNKPEKAILNSGVFVTRALNEEYLTEFMYWLLASEVFNKYIKYMETGSTIKHLYQETFVNFSYPLPTIEEQGLIIKYLNGKVGQIDRIKNEILDQIEKLKEYRQSLIYEAVTGKIDVSDIEINS